MLRRSWRRWWCWAWDPLGKCSRRRRCADCASSKYCAWCAWTGAAALGNCSAPSFMLTARLLLYTLRLSLSLSNKKIKLFPSPWKDLFTKWSWVSLLTTSIGCSFRLAQTKILSYPLRCGFVIQYRHATVLHYLTTQWASLLYCRALLGIV